MLRGALRQALLRQTLQHDGLHVARVKVREVNQCLTHHLVQGDLVRVLLLGANYMALLVLLDRDLRRLCHLRDEDTSHLDEDRAVEFKLCGVRGGRRKAAGPGPGRAVEHQRRGRPVARGPALLELEEDPGTEGLPELHADLEGLLVRPHGDADEVVERGDHVPLLRLHCCHVVLEEGCEQQGDLVVEDLPEDPLRPRQRRTSLRRALWELLDLLDDPLKATHQLRLVLLNALVQAGDLIQAPRALDPVLQGIPEVDQECLDEVSFEDVAEWDPLQEVGKSRQRRGQQRPLDRARVGYMALEDEVAELIDR
mmetsp:Transcript_1208/g.3674  ORF Transcript_1208/g.3674 Transcript_1208/m.3674 type:complete len:311 (+) Transcript_1208:1941-2873(+)